MKPNFQNYVDGDLFRINPNGRRLVELMDELRSSNVRPTESAYAGKSKKILLVTHYAPSFAHAGGLRIRDMYAEIRKANPDLQIDLYSASHPKVDGDLSGLSEIFSNQYFDEPGQLTFDSFQLQSGERTPYDVVDFQFHEAGRLAKSFAPLTKRSLFTPMESLARSYFELTAAKLARENFLSLHDVFGLIQTCLDELKITRNVDTTVCVSDADAGFLRRLAPWRKIEFVSTGLSPYEFDTQLEPDFVPVPLEQKKNRLVFAAYFGSDTNVVGLRWYLSQVHPKVLEACPDYKLIVVGRGDLSAIQAEGHKGVNFVGEVPLLSPILEQAKAGLVLALHGGGFRGKINQYAVCGLPSISTALGATGLCYIDGQDIVIADTPAEFAGACVRILSDDVEAARLAETARKTALDNYHWQASKDKIAALYGL
ncbi:glycosyltransferase family 4 protein [Caulobacter endophyticus]|uniref:Uncharacterized protein n=1 Tax=Caulobacter endophyticus TaxID=2172652 RepID=A0A2T9JZL4_9CAUL|nr:glycosyltransferase family 4 protein [Caulobacter endophyticus]PVM89166.1 hypothetical protein DDF67_12575 [Caulobacter endophyticus]